MKYGVSVDYLLGRVSPSMRREWIEMNWVSFCEISLPSPSMRREWIEISNDAKAY